MTYFKQIIFERSNYHVQLMVLNFTAQGVVNNFREFYFETIRVYLIARSLDGRPCFITHERPAFDCHTNEITNCSVKFLKNLLVPPSSQQYGRCHRGPEKYFTKKKGMQKKKKIILFDNSRFCVVGQNLSVVRHDKHLK